MKFINALRYAVFLAGACAVAFGLMGLCWLFKPQCEALLTEMEGSYRIT